MDGLTIRDGKISDVNTIVRFQKNMARETENRELSDDCIKPGVMAVFNEDEKGFYLVAESNGEVVGSLLVTYEWSDWRNGWFWWIQSVYVAKEWRRKGVYRYLNDEVTQRCRKTGGICGVRLYVEKNNTTAQNVYKNLGMKETDYLLYEWEL
jgi:ribosomal protein S18 acetylase RimI-like enzyme